MNRADPSSVQVEAATVRVIHALEVSGLGKRVPLPELAHERWTLSAPAVLNVQHLHQVFQASGLPAPRVAIEARPLGLRLQLCASTDLLSFSARRTLQVLAPRCLLMFTQN